MFSGLENAVFPSWELPPGLVFLGAKGESPNSIFFHFLRNKEPHPSATAHLPSVIKPLHVSPGKDAALDPVREQTGLQGVGGEAGGKEKA